MNKLTRGAGIMSLATVSALALAACNDIEIDSPNGQGTCGGNAFTLTTAQNTSGDNLTIDYTGPSTTDMSLFLSHGFYDDNPLFSDAAFSLGIDDEAYAVKLDVTNAGWSTSGSGVSTTYSFSGSIEELLVGGTTIWDAEGAGAPEVDLYNRTFPAVIGVDCDTSNATGVVDPADSWAAAQATYPNNMLINALEVVSSEPITDGARVTFRYPADAVTSFGLFDAVAPVEMSLFSDDPSISNDTLANMWLQGFASSYGAIATTAVTNPDGSFTIEFTGDGEALPDDQYLLISFIPNEALDDARVVFSSMTYNAASGFKLESLPFLPELPASPASALPDTGVSSAQVGLIAAGGALLALAGIVMVSARRRRQS